MLPWVVHCCLFLGPDCSYILQGLERTGCKLFCFVQTKTLYMYHGYMYFLAEFVLVFVDVMVMSSAYAMP